MENVLLKNSLGHDIDFKAACTLCRDGWSLQETNEVLKNIELTTQQFDNIQERAKLFDSLETEFGPPIDIFPTTHRHLGVYLDRPEINFLNRGPDAAAAVLKEYGWSRTHIDFVVKAAMFSTLNDESPALGLSGDHGSSGSIVATTVIPKTQLSNMLVPGKLPRPPRLENRSSVSRDASILAFMAAFAFVLLFAFL